MAELGEVIGKIAKIHKVGMLRSYSECLFPVALQLMVTVLLFHFIFLPFFKSSYWRGIISNPKNSRMTARSACACLMICWNIAKALLFRSINISFLQWSTTLPTRIHQCARQLYLESAFARSSVGQAWVPSFQVSLYPHHSDVLILIYSPFSLIKISCGD